MLHVGELRSCGTDTSGERRERRARRSALLGKVTREDDALALRLLYERRKGAKSRWGPHIALLPATPPHALLRWSEAELAELAGSDALELANRWRSQVSSDFSEIVDKSRAAVEESDPGKQLSAAVKASLRFPWLDLEGFSWAVSMIWSRCVSVSRKGAPPIKAFLPVVDMHNHDPGAPENHGFDDARDGFVLRRTGNAKKGDELKLCYDGLPNAWLLLLYGFALDHAAHAGRDLYAPLSPEAPHYEAKRAALEKLGLGATADGAAPFRLAADDALPERLLTALMAQRATLDELPGLPATSEATARASGGWSPRATRSSRPTAAPRTRTPRRSRTRRRRRGCASRSRARAGARRRVGARAISNRDLAISSFRNRSMSASSATSKGDTSASPRAVATTRRARVGVVAPVRRIAMSAPRFFRRRWASSASAAATETRLSRAMRALM
ncbi:mRNA (guanine-N7-)-methyltransferase [Aureococcus anophagefferens]|nr:mRNA (guanine-N7-)-methyltransferase [Aureococcus anophagefferens]